MPVRYGDGQRRTAVHKHRVVRWRRHLHRRSARVGIRYCVREKLRDAAHRLIAGYGVSLRCGSTQEGRRSRLT